MSPRPAIDHIRKPQILRAAAEVITERGLTATRISDIAERAGTSPPAVLYWFGSREGLLTEALAGDEADYGEALDSRLLPIPTARGKLRALLEASALDGDLSLWIELWCRSLHDAAAREQRRRLDLMWRSRISATIAAGQESGEFDRRIDAGSLAIKLAALMDGLSVQTTLRDPDVSPARMLEICVEYAELELGTKLDPAVEEVAA